MSEVQAAHLIPPPCLPRAAWAPLPSPPQEPVLAHWTSKHVHCEAGQRCEQGPEPSAGAEGTKDRPTHCAPAAGTHPSMCTSHASALLSPTSRPVGSAFVQGLVLCDKARCHATPVGGRVARVCVRALPYPQGPSCHVSDCRQDVVCHSRTFHPSTQPIKIKKITFKSSSGLQGVIRSPGRPRVGGLAQE